jgi:hypothetical protein
MGCCPSPTLIVEGLEASGEEGWETCVYDGIQYRLGFWLSEKGVDRTEVAKEGGTGS